jgi:hypothetical protein
MPDSEYELTNISVNPEDFLPTDSPYKAIFDSNPDQKSRQEITLQPKKMARLDIYPEKVNYDYNQEEMAQLGLNMP